MRHAMLRDTLASFLIGHRAMRKWLPASATSLDWEFRQRKRWRKKLLQSVPAG